MISVLIFLITSSVLAAEPPCTDLTDIVARDSDGLYSLASRDGKVIVKEADITQKFDLLAPYFGYPALPITSENGVFCSKGHAEALINVIKVLQHFESEFNYTGLDGNGSVVEVILYNNDTAQFLEGYVLLGLNRFAQKRKPVTALIDIIAHELFHGILKATSGIGYGHAGAAALNEGLADIMGVYAKYKIQRQNFKYQFGVGFYDSEMPMRSLSNPSSLGGVDHYSKFDNSDSDGHSNCGIINLAFYLFAEGGSHPKYGGENITGVGIDTAAKIFFEAAVGELTEGSDFSDARRATLRVAKKFNSKVVKSLARAWDQVGVIE